MKAVLLLFLLSGAACLAASESVVPALSDNAFIAEGRQLLVADGIATFLTLKDSRGGEVRLSYRSYIDPKTPHHDRFGVRTPAHAGSEFLSKDSEEEKVLLGLVLRAYRNTFGNPDAAPPARPSSPQTETAVDWKHLSALAVLKAIERRKNTTTNR